MSQNTELVDATEILRRSNRFDFIYKLALLKAWEEGSASDIREAEEAYLEMTRAMLKGFREPQTLRTKPKDFIEDFKKTASSIKEKGFDLNKEPIPIALNDEFINGAHRLSCCAYYGFKVPIAVFDTYKRDCRIENFVEGNINKAVLYYGARKYFELLPSGRHCKFLGAKENYPPLPFPNWSRKRIKISSIKPMFIVLWNELMLPFCRGEKLEKRRHRINREFRNAFSLNKALYDYWKERDKETKQRFFVGKLHKTKF